MEEKKEERVRAFIAIEIPKKVKEEIKKVQRQLPEFKGKLTEERNLHLTLKFLGHIDKKALDMCRKNLGKVEERPFGAQISGLGVFSKSQVRIVWLRMKNCDGLQKKIDNALSGLFDLTIARVKSVKDRARFLAKLLKIKTSEMNFTVKSFSLKRSKLTRAGPTYETIEDYALS